MKKKESIKDSFGIFLLTASPIVAEVCSTTLLNWIMIDMEASPASKMDVINILQALKGTAVIPLVRVPSNDKQIIEQVLDMGASGVLVPKVDNDADAKKVVDAFYYPPVGNRGINPVRASNYFKNLESYLNDANSNLICMVQIESATAVENVEDIAANPEIDVLFIGCGDLAASYGQSGIVTGEKMDLARKKVLEACVKYNKIPGIFAYNNELAREYKKEGFSLIATGNDIKSIQESIVRSLNYIRGVGE